MGPPRRDTSPAQGREAAEVAEFIRRLEANAADAETWYALGVRRGGVVGGKRFDTKRCLERCLEADANNRFAALAWLYLERLGGGTVRGKFYDTEACRQKSVSPGRCCIN